MLYRVMLVLELRVFEYSEYLTVKLLLGKLFYRDKYADYLVMLVKICYSDVDN